MRIRENSQGGIDTGSGASVVTVAEGSSSRRTKVMEQSAYVFVAQIFGLSCGLLGNFLVAWMLGPTGKGSFYLVQLIASLGQVFLNCGLGSAAVYYLQRDKRFSDQEIRSSVLWSSVLLGILPLGICGLAWPWLVGVVGSKMSPVLLLMALASIPGMVVSWNVSYISLARGSIAAFNFLRTAPSLLFLLGLALMVVRHNYTTLGVAICWFVAVSVTAALSPAIVRPIAEELQPRERGFIRSAAHFGFRSHLGAITQYLQHRNDAVLVGYFCPLRDVGIYSLAVSIAELLWYLPNTIANVLITHVAGSSEEAGARLTAAFCRATLAITAILAVVLGVVSMFLIPLILPAFRSASFLLWILLPGTVSVTVFKIISSDLNGRGRPLETFRPAAVSLGACFASGLIVIPLWGIMGAAIVTSAGYVLNGALCLRIYSRITSVPIESLIRVRYADLLIMRDFWRKKSRLGTTKAGGIDTAGQDII